MFASNTLKSLSIGLFAVLIFSAPRAQAQPSSERLEEKAQNISDLIQREARYLSASEAIEVDSLLTQIRRVIKNDNGRDFIDEGRLASVAVTIENRAYNFKVASTIELVDACMATRAGISQSVDEVEVSINFLRTKAARNGGSWWKGSLEVCGVVADLARELGLDEGLSRHNHVVAFSLEGKDELTFSLVGRNASEMGDRCMDKLSRMNLPSVDEISLIVDGSGLIQMRNTGSWWKTSGEICQQIVSAAARKIRD